MKDAVRDRICVHLLSREMCANMDFFPQNKVCASKMFLTKATKPELIILMLILHKQHAYY